MRKIIKTRSLSAQAKKNYAFLTSNYPALPCITQSTSSVIGNEYFNNLVQSLASVFGVRYAFIGIVTGTLIKKIKTLALWDGNKLTKNFVYDLEGTPCEKVTKMEVCYYPQAVQEYFPNDSYLGVSMLNSEKKLLGLISVMDENLLRIVTTTTPSSKFLPPDAPVK